MCNPEYLRAKCFALERIHLEKAKQWHTVSIQDDAQMILAQRMGIHKAR